MGTERFGAIETNRECRFGAEVPKPQGQWESNEEADGGEGPQAFGTFASNDMVDPDYQEVSELGYWNPSREPPIIYPSSNRNKTLTFGAGTWGSWTVVEASTAEDTILQQIVVSKMIVSSGLWWLQIGVGAEGEEEVLATIGDNLFISGSGALPLVNYDKRLPPIAVPAESRLVVRGWHACGNAGGAVIFANLPDPSSWVTPWPNTYIEGNLAVSMDRIPAVDDFLNVGTTWTEVIASAASDLLLDGAEFDCTLGRGGPGNVLQIAVGAESEEIIIAQIPFTAAIMSLVHSQVRTVRKALIEEGERVSARWIHAFTAGPNAAFWFETI